MENAQKSRSEIDEQYRWDLTPMFASDAAWEKAFNTLDAAFAPLAAFEGKLNNAQTVLDFMQKEIEANRLLENLYCYAMLRHSEDTRDAAAQSMYTRVAGKAVQLSAAMAFAEPELLALPQERLDALVRDASLADYRFLLMDLLRQKPHTLSDKEEKLMAAMGEVARAPKAIANALEDADLLYGDAKDSAGKSHNVSGANYILLQSSPDRTLRKNAFSSYYKSYKNHRNTFAAAYAGAIQAERFEAQARHYSSTREMSMAEENIPVSVYDNLVQTVRRHLPAMERYVSLRRRILGVEELHYYDVYAPLTENLNITYTYEQAQQMVLEAVAPLGEEYGKVVRKGFASRWIDVFPNAGKQGGAYSGGSYDSNPYIMANFTGTLDSVSTIAHEIGHSMHTWFSKHAQPPQYADYTLFVAEVASTVNENLMIEQLLRKPLTPQMELYLLNQYLENFKGTVFRQTMFAEFEQQAHAACERGEALSADKLDELYAALVKDYFGPELVWDDEVKYEWERIPHFYRPFYVYKYATGYASAVAISEAILQQGVPAVERYLGFLSMGSSAYPLEELKATGVDLTTPAPVEAALAKFERILDRAQAVYETIEAENH